jgi:hypothetical protein
MKKFLVFGLVAVIGLFAVIAVPGASAAPAAALSTGPYEGTFNGTVYAPNGSSAPMSLILTHRGRTVDGTVFIGEGLSIDAGMCGSAAIPASSVYANGKTSASNPKVLSTSSSFNVSGIDVTVALNSKIQGDTLNASAKIDLPWLCGGDPVLNGTLYRAA